MGTTWRREKSGMPAGKEILYHETQEGITVSSRVNC